jgi:hypothetical protein
MITHLNKDRFCNLKKVIFNDGTNNKQIKRIFQYSNGIETDYYPPPPQKIRIQTNYDNWPLETRILSSYSIVYPVPVIDCENKNTAKPIKITVIPFPENSGWTVSSSENFDCSKYSNTIHYGVKELEFDVPVPKEIGYDNYKINVSGINSNCETQTFAFYCVKYAPSTLTPVAHWSFNSDNLKDEISGNEFVKQSELEGCVFDAGSAGGRSVNLSFNDVFGEYKAPIDMNLFKDDKGDATGMSLMLTYRGYKKLWVGLIDSLTPHLYDGNHFYVAHSYRQPENAVLAKNNMVGKFSVSDRLDPNKWHNLTMTMSPVIDLLNLEDEKYKDYKNLFIVDTSENEYGNVTFVPQMPNSTYKWSRVGNKNNQFLNKNFYRYRVANFFVDGELRGEAVVEILPEYFNKTIGDGFLTMKFEHEINAIHEFVDDIKLFNGVINKSEIIKEVSILGYQFNADGSLMVERKPEILRDGRKRVPPGSFIGTHLTPTMKVFIIDSQTIALACNFREALVERLNTEFPNLDAVDSNFKYGYLQQYQMEYTYTCNFWDLYRNYVPLIIEQMDNKNNFLVDGKSITLIGRWQNSTGIIAIPDAFEGTKARQPAVADISHFAYIKLSTKMKEDSEHTISYLNDSITFTYSKDRYCSSIKVNQIGYSTLAGRKYAYWGQWIGTGGAYVSQYVGDGKPFYLVDSSTNKKVYKGEMKLRINGNYNEETDVYGQDEHAPKNKPGKVFQLTGEVVYQMDFSSFNTEGRYKVYIPNVGYSHEFPIEKNVFGEAFYTYARGLFHHRSGCDQIKKPFTNWEYDGISHQFTYESMYPCDDTDFSACLSDDNRQYGSIFTKLHFQMIPHNATGKIFRDVKGGWYDAADFDRRPYHFRVVKDLLNTFLLSPSKFLDEQLNLPESKNGIPDILSEAEWGLDHLRKAQREDGAIAAWIETEMHEADWPWLSNLKYYLGTPNRQDSLRYAQAAAKLARALKMVRTPEGNIVPLALKKSAMFLNSAIRAFEFGINPENAAKFRFSQKDEFGNNYNFRYNETASKADVYIFPAAVSLFMATKDSRFSKYINEETYNKHFNNWRNNENEWTGLLCEELALGELERYFPVFTKNEQKRILEQAKLWYNRQESHVYHSMYWERNHDFLLYGGWGMTHPESRGRGFVYAYYILKNEYDKTKDKKIMDEANAYKDATYLIMDEFLGCNPMGRSGTTGLGIVSPVHFLNSWLKEAEIRKKVYEPVPGISPYGCVGLNSNSNDYGFRLTRQGVSDFSFASVGINILPGGYSNKVANSQGEVAVWLEKNWPLQRSIFEVELFNPPQSEFTIWETTGGKIFLTGFLMGDGWMPSQKLLEKAPSTDKYAVEGLIYLP